MGDGARVLARRARSQTIWCLEKHRKYRHTAVEGVLGGKCALAHAELGSRIGLSVFGVEGQERFLGDGQWLCCIIMHCRSFRRCRAVSELANDIFLVHVCQLRRHA